MLDRRPDDRVRAREAPQRAQRARPRDARAERPRERCVSGPGAPARAQPSTTPIGTNATPGQRAEHEAPGERAAARPAQRLPTGPRAGLASASGDGPGGRLDAAHGHRVRRRAGRGTTRAPPRVTARRRSKPGALRTTPGTAPRLGNSIHALGERSAPRARRAAPGRSRSADAAGRAARGRPRRSPRCGLGPVLDRAGRHVAVERVVGERQRPRRRRAACGSAPAPACAAPARAGAGSGRASSRAPASTRSTMPSVVKPVPAPTSSVSRSRRSSRACAERPRAHRRRPEQRVDPAVVARARGSGRTSRPPACAGSAACDPAPYGRGCRAAPTPGRLAPRPRRCARTTAAARRGRAGRAVGGGARASASPTRAGSGGSCAGGSPASSTDRPTTSCSAPTRSRCSTRASTCSVSGLCGRIWTLARDYPRLDGPEDFRAWDEPGTVRVLFAPLGRAGATAAPSWFSEARVEPVDRDGARCA